MLCSAAPLVLICLSANQVSPVLTSLILLSEPVFAIIIASALGESPSISAVAGCVLIVLGAGVGCMNKEFLTVLLVVRKRIFNVGKVIPN